MIKRKFWVTPVILAAFATMMFTGCDSPTGNGNDIPGHNQPGGPGNGGNGNVVVTFNANGGSFAEGAASVTATVQAGQTLTPPTGVTKAGYTFQGWFSAETGGTEFAFAATPITAAMTVWARWQALPPGYFQVIFNSGGGNHVEPATVRDGETVDRPTEPTRSGYIFAGWFTAETDGEEFDFAATQITGNTTIWARWTAIPVFTVTFYSDSGTEVDPQSVLEGTLATKPTPTRPRVVPAGLWLSAEFAAASEYSVYEWRQYDGTSWDFEAYTVTEDITLTAHWTAPAYTPTLPFTTIADAMTHVNAIQDHSPWR
jgi:uncharacterized repeat protein (TIGR02543 family)